MTPGYLSMGGRSGLPLQILTHPAMPRRSCQKHGLRQSRKPALHPQVGLQANPPWSLSENSAC